MAKEIEVHDVYSLLTGMKMLGLTVKETAKELNVSERTIFRMIQDGRLKASKHDMPFGKDIWLINPLSIARLEVKKQMAKENKPLRRKRKSEQGSTDKR